MENFDFKEWKKSNLTDMLDLTYSKPDDVFIFIRFTENSPSEFEGKYFLFADDFEEAARFIHYIYMCDILYDAIDDVEYDFKSQFDERQEKILSLLYFWHKSAKILDSKNPEKELIEFCNDFNSTFNNTKNTEYQISVLKGIYELKEFLIENFGEHENFDIKRLCNLCDKELYAGRLLKEFIDSILTEYSVF